MIFRMAITIATFLLAVYAFLSNAFNEGHFFNPFGLLFLMLTAIIWFAWGSICEAFRSAQAESALPILPIARLGASITKGMMHPQRDHRRSDEPSSSGL